MNCIICGYNSPFSDLDVCQTCNWSSLTSSDLQYDERLPTLA